MTFGVGAVILAAEQENVALELAVYISVAWSVVLFFFLLVFRGGSGRRTKWNIFVLFFACLFWPLTLLVLGLMLAGVIKRLPFGSGKRLDARAFL